MSADAVIEKYSQSLFEAVSEGGKADNISKELEAIAKIFSEEAIATFFASPFNSADNKVMVAKAALEGKCSPETFNFIVMLVQNERMGVLTQINENFQASVRSMSGETEGILYMATEPSAEFKQQVEKRLSEALKKTVRLNTQKDPSLLSGFKVTVGGWTLDDSAQFHLNKLKEDISKRGM
ncbi:MAG: ATP synthase F1 subunit delta [Bdellovibrionaceae bacterium]|nr:ATP synthase F1 subunit delta [Bdellovibrio sp.]